MNSKKTTFAKAQKKADDAFSRLIRAEQPVKHCEYHWRCHKMKIMPRCKCGDILQCCHKVSRSNHALRYDKRNVFPGCEGSNRFFSFAENGWPNHWPEIFPEDELYLKQPKFRAVCKRSKEDLLAMATYFDSERAKL